MNDPATESPVCETTFETVPNGQFCTGLHYTPQGRMDAGDCMRACCAQEDCHAWAWAYWNQSTLHSTQCYIANSTNYSCKGAVQGGVEVRKGGTRITIPAYPPHFSYADLDFDDRPWTTVDVPHDSLINGTYKKEGPWIHFNHGSLPRNVSWYRKRFVLPTEWQTQAIMLRFGAIFHRASVWLNGGYVGTWGGGYSPIDLRLDNMSFIKFGSEENVLAIRADPSYGSGRNPPLTTRTHTPSTHTHTHTHTQHTQSTQSTRTQIT
jgi:hypothetical protein